MENGVRIELTPEEIAELNARDALAEAGRIDYEWKIIRLKRNNLLKDSDTLALPDRWNSYTEEQQTAISTYRQALRDITTQSDPDNIVWPTIPN
jgi:hypothetical protein